MKELGYLTMYFANGEILTYVGNRVQISEAIHQINTGVGFVPVLERGIEKNYIIRNIVSFILTNKPLEEAQEKEEIKEVVVKGFTNEIRG